MGEEGEMKDEVEMGEEVGQEVGDNGGVCGVDPVGVACGGEEKGEVPVEERPAQGDDKDGGEGRGKDETACEKKPTELLGGYVTIYTGV